MAICGWLPFGRSDKWASRVTETYATNGWLFMLVAPCRAMLLYCRCDTPYGAIPFSGRLAPPQMVRHPPWYLVRQAHLCDTPFCYIWRHTCAIPIKTNTKDFCDTIATSIARHEKYRCQASKCIPPLESLDILRLVAETARIQQCVQDSCSELLATDDCVSVLVSCDVLSSQESSL